MEMYRLQRGSLLFIFLFIAVIFSAGFSQGNEKPVGTKLEMIHVNDFRRANGMQPITRFEHLKQSLDRDIIRHKKNRNRRQARECPNAKQTCTNNVSGDMALYSGADLGSGEYFVSLSIGSPPQKVVLIADTGSDLTWVKCDYLCNGTSCGEKSRKPIFHAKQSSSFKTVPCSSGMCKNELTDLNSLPDDCPSPQAPCNYEYEYLSEETTHGIFANETITFDQTNREEAKIDGMIVGCSQPSDIENFRSVHGVMGLGYNNYSFTIKAANKFGNKFSYCLVDHLSTKNVSSYLIFGSHESIESIKTLSRMQQTELVLGSDYGVNIKGISVGSKMLKVPAEVWDLERGGGMMLDSGTSLTYLTKPAYEPVMAALTPSFKNFARLNLSIGQLEFCYNLTVGYNESLVPRLVFHFADGQQFEPPVENYVMDVGRGEGTRCLGFVQSDWPDKSIMGNVMQQNHFWEFDLANSRLSFGSSSCT